MEVICTFQGLGGLKDMVILAAREQPTAVVGSNTTRRTPSRCQGRMLWGFFGEDPRDEVTNETGIEHTRSSCARATYMEVCTCVSSFYAPDA